MTVKQTKSLDIDDLVQLDNYQLRQVVRGELCYIEHPTKGLCEALPQNVYVKVQELSVENKNRIEKLNK